MVTRAVVRPIAHSSLHLHRHQHVVQAPVGLVHVMHVAGGNDRNAHASRQPPKPRAHLPLFRQSGVHRFEVVGVTENFAIGKRNRCCLNVTADEACHLTAKAARQHDKALAMAIEGVKVDAWLPVKAGQPCPRDQAQQRSVALVAVCQHGQMVRRPLLGGSIIVDATSDRGVHLAADNRSNTGTAASAIKRHHSVQAAVIGDGKRRLTQSRGCLRQLVASRKPIQRGVLAVDV